MNNFKFGNRSETNMQGIHPDLVAVLRLGLAYSPYDFGVTCGVRTAEEQREIVESGASQTMDSAHVIQSSGFGHAVDLYVIVPGESDTYQHKYFRKVIQALVRAAIEFGVQVEFGGLWRDFVDSPHVQLAAWKYGGTYS